MNCRKLYDNFLLVLLAFINIKEKIIHKFIYIYIYITYKRNKNNENKM